jgi:LysR family transcriptional regulator, hydrogen peroxide-inducible genes activator
VAWRTGSSRGAEGRLLAQTLRDLPPAALSPRHSDTHLPH